MREILFKAKHIDSEDWVEGDLIHEPFGICIQVIRDGHRSKSVYLHKVNDSTICQYTGLEDKNGKKIWENDIVLFTDDIKINGETSHVSKVEWNTDIGGADCIGYYNINPAQIENYSVEVIGNIFDNPELLGLKSYKSDIDVER